MTTLLERALADAKRRVDQVISYARGGTCRHAALAAHLGERLSPCQTSCDACMAAAEGRPLERLATTAPATRRSNTTAADALAVLKAVRTLPFGMGKTRARPPLERLDRKPRPRRPLRRASALCPTFRRAKIEQISTSLVDDDFLLRDSNHEFKLIR